MALPERRGGLNWFSINQKLPVPARSAAHEEDLISVDDKGRRTGSWSAQTGLNLPSFWRCAEWAATSASCELFASFSAGKYRSGKMRGGQHDRKSRFCCINNIMPLSGQRHIRR